MPATETRPAIRPLLESGDRLERDEFERRYEARADDLKCELIGGIVYVASPVREPHASHAGLLGGWLFLYMEATPRVSVCHDPTLRLGAIDEPQPDLLLRITQGGASLVDGDGYIVGPPELVIEVAHSSVAHDLHDKKDCYARHRCREYLVVLVEEREARWFSLDGTRYVPLTPEADGTLRSRVFPGLWLDPRALFAPDPARLSAVVRDGVATPEHAAFVAGLGA